MTHYNMEYFNLLKRKFVSRLEKAKINKEADEPIYYILDYINSLDNYFTTSSCAGRIILISVPENGKKKDAKFLYKTHYKTFPNILYENLLRNYKKEKNIWFKMEPFILHVASNNFENSIKIVRIAQISGFKHSGIISERNGVFFVEIQGTDRISTILSKNHKLLVDYNYIKVLVDEANKKLEKNRKKIKVFYENLIKRFG